LLRRKRLQRSRQQAKPVFRKNPEWRQQTLLKEYKRIVFRFRVHVHSVRLFVVPARRVLLIRAIRAILVRRNLRFVRWRRVNCVVRRFNRHVRLNRLWVSMPIRVVTVIPDIAPRPFGISLHACSQDYTTTIPIMDTDMDVLNLVTALNTRILARVNTTTMKHNHN
jgi:hypothetical protein